MASAVVLLAVGEAGCFAMATPGAETSFSSWSVDERVGLPAASSTPASQPTPVVVVPNETVIAELDEGRVLCRGEQPCDVLLAPGSHRIALYEDDARSKPRAQFWLDVDSRPLTLEVESPKVGLAYAGAVLAIVGLVSVVFGAAAHESGGDEGVSNALLFGGAALAVTGLSLGFVYWVSGQGTVHARPSALPVH